MRVHRHVLLALVVASSAHAQGAGPVTLAPAEKSAAAVITPDLLRAHVRFLSDDLLEGRGPATRGDALAQKYTGADYSNPIQSERVILQILPERQRTQGL